MLLITLFQYLLHNNPYDPFKNLKILLLIIQSFEDCSQNHIFPDLK